ncbi:MAG: HEPN domain-containing protein [Anaerolineales bacterium]
MTRSIKISRESLTPDMVAPAALMNLRWELDGVRALLNTYDDLVVDWSARRDPNLEVLKRAGIILTVTAGETFIENILIAQFEARLGQALNPDTMRETFNFVAQTWLDTKPKPPDLDQWAGEGWKKLMLARFMHDIEGLNTPSNSNIRKLFARYLGIDITSRWKWSRVSATQACQKLDRLIELRGNLAHKGKDHLFDRKASVLRRQLTEAIILVAHLADCTGKALGIRNVIKEVMKDLTKLSN